MHLWTIQRYKKFYSNTNVRSGLRVRYDQDIPAEVKESIVRFVKWLRDNYEFPFRVNIYVKSDSSIVAWDGEPVNGVFRYNDDRYVEPYIKVATGDFNKNKEKYGRDDALATILGTIIHELTHYFQWINNTSQTDRGMEYQATLYKKWILYEYSHFTDHP